MAQNCQTVYFASFLGPPPKTISRVAMSLTDRGDTGLPGKLHTVTFISHRTPVSLQLYRFNKATAVQVLQPAVWLILVVLACRKLRQEDHH